MIHWPVAFPPGKLFTPHPEKDEILVVNDPPLAATWKAMLELPKTGKVKAVGVSNFSIKHIEGIYAATGVYPAVNQIERHPLNPQWELVEYCKKHNIHVTAYSPLGNNITGKTKLVDYPEVKDIADRLGATSAQVLIAWGAYDGCSVIPKSVQKGASQSDLRYPPHSLTIHHRPHRLELQARQALEGGLRHHHRDRQGQPPAVQRAVPVLHQVGPQVGRQHLRRGGREGGDPPGQHRMSDGIGLGINKNEGLYQ